MSSAADYPLLRRMADCSHDLVVITDVHRCIVFANRAARERTGYGLKELTGRKMPMLYPPRDRAKYTARIQRGIHEKGFWSGELEILKKDGEGLWTSASIFPYRDARGKPAGMIGIGHDLRHERLLEQRSWESESRLQYVIEAMEDAVCVTDRKGRIVMCNGAHCRMLGYRRDEIVGMKIPYPWVETGDGEKFRQGFKIVAKEGKLKNYTLAWRRRDQSRLVVSLSFSVLRVRSDVPEGFVMVIRDVSEVHYIEELHRSYERIQRLMLDVKRKAGQLQTLEEVNRLVLGNANVADIFLAITSGIGKLVAHDLAGMYVYEPGKKILIPFALSRQTAFSRKLARYPLSIGRGIIGNAARTGRMVMVNNAQHDPRSDYPEGMRPQKEHFVAVPLRGREVLFGVLVVARNRDPEFIEEEALLVKSFAQAAMVALENARLYQDTHRRTGGKSRQHSFDALVSRHLLKSRR